MARTITEIQDSIIASIQADANLAQLSSTSATAIWRLLTYVVAVAIAALENLFDVFKIDVAAQLEQLKPHTTKWYREKALNYHHGFDLIEGDDEYDLEGFTDQEIEDAKIVTAAAAIEEGSILIVKVNAGATDNLTPLSTAQFEGFEAYVAQIKDAGVQVQVRSNEADVINLTIDLYYDPQILSNDGSRLDGTANTPIKDAIVAFLNAIPFDGVFIKAHLVDALQDVEGVFVPEIRTCLVKTFAAVDFTAVDIKYNPFSGFLKLYDDADLTINYIPNV